MWCLRSPWPDPCSLRTIRISNWHGSVSGHKLAQPAVLELKVLQALHLLGLQPAELSAPPIIRHLAHADLADCVHYVLALREQNIDLPQLRDDLFRLVSLPCHKRSDRTSITSVSI